MISMKLSSHPEANMKHQGLIKLNFSGDVTVIFQWRNDWRRVSGTNGYLLKETKFYLSFLQVTGIKFALGGTWILLFQFGFHKWSILQTKAVTKQRLTSHQWIKWWCYGAFLGMAILVKATWISTLLRDFCWCWLTVKEKYGWMIL